MPERLFLTERSAIDGTARKLISGRCLRDPLGKQRTNNRTRDLMIRSREECEGAVAVAYPDLGGSGIEIEDAFFRDLGCGFGRGKDFDANLRGARQKGKVLADLIPTGIKPTDINSLDAVSGRNRALGQRMTPGSKLNQQSNNMTLALRMAKTGWGSHEDMPMAISLDAIGHLGEVRVTKNLGPTDQIESGLRSEIWKLNGDRHEGMIRQK
jgi:hypothetical protein